MAKPGNDRRIDYIEFAVSDITRSREFFGKAFGWTFTSNWVQRIDMEKSELPLI